MRGAILGTAFLLGLVAPGNGKEPDPTKWEKTIAGFETQDKAKAPPKNPIVFTGSSSIARWRDVQKFFPDYPTLNRGFGGSTTPEVIHFLDRIIIPYAPKIVVLYSGGNDLAALKHSPEQVLASFETLADRVQEKLPETKIYYLSLHLPPGRVKMKAVHDKANELIQKSCEKHTKGNRIFVDLRSTMLDKGGSPDPKLYADPLHPTAEAYEKWAKLLRPLFRRDYPMKEAK